MTYCHTTAQLNRYLDEIDLQYQREFAMQAIREEVERDIAKKDGCCYWNPENESYDVVTYKTVKERAMMTDYYQRLHDWYEDTDSERTRRRLGEAYTRLLERKLAEVVEEVTKAIFYHGGKW